MAVRSELKYDQNVPLTGQGEIVNLGTYTASFELNQTDAQGNIIGKRTVQKVTLIRTDEGLFAVPGDMETQQIPWHELRDILPDKALGEMQKAIKRGKSRRKRRLSSRD